MGRFAERYSKHPERGTERYIDQAKSYICSLTLQRGFGEDINGFLSRNPEVKEAMRITHEDIIYLESMPAYVNPSLLQEDVLA